MGSVFTMSDVRQAEFEEGQRRIGWMVSTEQRFERRMRLARLLEEVRDLAAEEGIDINVKLRRTFRI